MIVVKVGGAEGIDYEAVAKDAASLWKEGERLLLVHGGSAETNKVAEALGHPPRFLTHPGGQVSRLTDRRTLEIFIMVYAGLVNKRLVELLQKEGVNALGLSGLDGRLLVGRRKTAVKYVEDGKVKIHRGDYTGTVEEVNKALLDLLLGPRVSARHHPARPELRGGGHQHRWGPDRGPSRPGLWGGGPGLPLQRAGPPGPLPR
jgi:acetylglutamate/LysW-gamma-L-alpha-aminoadipate kinase